MSIQRDFEKFLTDVWPVIQDRFDLGEEWEPTDEEFEMWCQLQDSDEDEEAPESVDITEALEQAYAEEEALEAALIQQEPNT